MMYSTCYIAHVHSNIACYIALWWCYMQRCDMENLVLYGLDPKFQMLAPSALTV